MQRLRSLAAAAAFVALASSCTPSGDPSASDSASGSASASPSGASASASKPAGSASAKPGIQRCATADLRITLGRGEGAAGSTYLPVRLKNTSDGPCRTGGYGGAALASGDPGNLVGRPADRLRKGPVRRFVLQKGGSAEATLQETNADNYPARRCRPTLARGVRVYPPNDTSSVFLARSTTACQSERVHQLAMTAFRRLG
jgi:hypothetical protein